VCDQALHAPGGPGARVGEEDQQWPVIGQRYSFGSRNDGE
jgi:hypothetical protein